MDRKDREKIDSCCDIVVKHLNLVTLWPKLLENKVFNRDDVNIPRWTKNLMDSEIVRDVYLTIKTRGPFAFQSLMCSLRQTGQESLADLLEGRIDNFEVEQESQKQSKNVDGNVRIAANAVDANRNGSNTGIRNRSKLGSPGDTFFHKIQVAQKPLEINMRKATKFMDGPEYEAIQRYPMRSNPRGLVLLITNISYKHSTDPPRDSAQHDHTNLKSLYEQMGFRVMSYQDLTGQNLIDRVKDFSQSREFRMVDSCFVIISSHGLVNEETHLSEIHGIDYFKSENGPSTGAVLCSEITDCFMAEVCPHLAGKPKIFIFQMCRGTKKQQSISYSRVAMDSCSIPQAQAGFEFTKQNKVSVRNYADMLVVHATMPHHVAFRDKVTGSWFIQILCEVFMNYACTTHVLDLLNMVDDRLNTVRTPDEECQTMMITSMGFSKHCYINPGLFDETL